jgi:transcriptional regulator with PAS, ATPase and Fis domain/Tfp pilus assembly protein PilF
MIRYQDARNLLAKRASTARKSERHVEAYRSLQVDGYGIEILADHAFLGGLYETAGTLYLELARKKFEEKDRRLSATYYDLVLECGLRDPHVQPLAPSDRLNLAVSYLFLSKETLARDILQSLIRQPAVREDAELLSKAYNTLSFPLIETSAAERVRILKLAIECLPKDSPQLLHRYRRLAMTFLEAGDTHESSTALEEGLRHCRNSEETHQMEDVRASLLMHQGNFKAAARCLMIGEFSWTTPGAVSNNLAVCTEHLGDLKRARELQLSALRKATSSGLRMGEIISLSNLGSMETKIGNMPAAKQYFDAAFSKLREIRSQEGDTSLSFAITYSDAIFFFIERGDFKAAVQCMEEMDADRIRPFPLERLSAMHTRCRLEGALGHSDAALKVLDQARTLPLRGDFFETEHLLAESRLAVPAPALCTRLRQAALSTQRLETQYQECQVFIALSRAHLAIGETFEANSAARRARRLGATHGYRLLEAEALLLVGISAKRKVEKDFFLARSLSESMQLGLAPLAAECGFRTGAWRLSIGDFAGAVEALSKSVAITTRLSEGLNASHRKAYLEKPDHLTARQMLTRASEMEVALTALPHVVEKQDVLFLKLYRLVAAMTASPDIESATTFLLETLTRSVEHPVVVVFTTAGRMKYYSSTSLSKQAKEQIIKMAEHASEKPYLAGAGLHQVRKSSVWVPLRSLSLSGGIFMQCPRGHTGPTEREIEFLTLAAVVAGAALDHAVTKTSLLSMTTSVATHGIIGTSKQANEILEQIQIASTNDANVLIEGESGTGKELVARAIHDQSARSKGSFIPVDCGALPQDLIEAELFGAKRGSYTGALSDRIGLFEAAHHGTIFLDEISNLGLGAQAKLLRVLQDREVRKIGSTMGKVVDVRLIAATNCNLDKLVKQGTFRKDLLYRLRVLFVSIPPLKDRKGDIPLLATTFLQRLNSKNHTQKFFGPTIIGKLTSYNYPGNVRELQNGIERAFYSTRSTVITHVTFLEETSANADVSFEAESWFRDLTEGRKDFWHSVHDPYKRRDIPREKVVALVDYGLRATRGELQSNGIEISDTEGSISTVYGLPEAEQLPTGLSTVSKTRRYRERTLARASLV